jgi:hypothetical protein
MAMMTETHKKNHIKSTLYEQIRELHAFIQSTVALRPEVVICFICKKIAWRPQVVKWCHWDNILFFLYPPRIAINKSALVFYSMLHNIEWVFDRGRNCSLSQHHIQRYLRIYVYVPSFLPKRWCISVILWTFFPQGLLIFESRSHSISLFIASSYHSGRATYVPKSPVHHSILVLQSGFPIVISFSWFFTYRYWARFSNFSSQVFLLPSSQFPS